MSDYMGDYSLKFSHETEKAFCVENEAGEVVYVAKKMVEDYRKHALNAITLTMPVWFAEKIGVA